MGDIRCSAILSCSEATFEIPKTYRTFRGRRVSHVAAPHAARHALNTSQRCDRHAQVAGAYHTLTMWALASCLAIGVLAAVLALARLARVALPVDHDPATRKCTSLAFFHPFAECGGGGERVLWAAVDALAKEDALTKPSKVKEREDSEQSAQSEQFGESGELEEGMDIVIYCQDVSTPEETSEEVLASHANSRFNLAVSPRSFRVVPIRYRNLLVPDKYPRLTMIFQALAAVAVTVECLIRGGFLPDIWVDTTGWAFGYPLLKLLKPRMKVVAYVHYPTVSSDMLLRVRKREAGYNNRETVSRSWLLSLAKAVYYQVFSYWYGFCGGCADVCMVNSTWTKGHVDDIFWWRGKRATTLVYPPCDCTDLSTVDLGPRGADVKQIISLAQFRPEKNHELQLDAVARVRDRTGASFKVLFVGGCRDVGDYKRVESLRRSAADLGLDHGTVEFLVNAPFSDLRRALGESIAGLHSMKDEHFGISVVEYMAAGVIPIAHNSAGPRMDIVTADTGFLCETPEEYSAAMETVLGMDEGRRLEMAALGRTRAASFAQEKFQCGFLNEVFHRPTSGT